MAKANVNDDPKSTKGMGKKKTMFKLQEKEQCILEKSETKKGYSRLKI